MSANNNFTAESGDINIVELWLRRDNARWMAGIAAGIVAGLVALVFAMVLSSIGGREFFFPAKLMATSILGAQATEFNAGFGTVLAGLIVYEALCAFFGFVFAHFTATNSLPALLGVGLAWGAFSWIFIWNLFLQSFSTFLNAGVGSGAVFFVCMVYGVALTSVAFFDRALRGK